LPAKAGANTGGVPKWIKGTDCKSVIRGSESHRRLWKALEKWHGLPARAWRFRRAGIALAVAVETRGETPLVRMGKMPMPRTRLEFRAVRADNA
jgi:hypothetical protein